MVICQTLWTNKKSLTENSFGWLTPQHHLMAWALSCLQLKKFYNEINLYTDENGAEILAGALKLPYKNISCDYEALDCPPDLWAYSKIVTYGKQTRPFIHVDGDVVLWKPFGENLVKSPLIAQNLETGTDYYSRLFCTFKSTSNWYPGYLKNNLFSETPKGYNAGILGGADLTFFKSYIAEAEKIIKKNSHRPLNLNFNIIFEQLLFYSLSKKGKIDVRCYFEKEYTDNGYDMENFAKFSNLHKSNYLHFIGSHKRNKDICDWISRFLFYYYPNTYFSVISLFQKSHHYFPTKIRELYKREPKGSATFKYPKTRQLLSSITKNEAPFSNRNLKKIVHVSENLILKSLYRYECKIHRILNQYKKISARELSALECLCVSGISFFSLNDKHKQEARITLNPHLEIIHSCYDWVDMQIVPDLINIRSSLKSDIVIGVIPGLFYDGYKELILDELAVNIILTVNNGILFNNLLQQAKAYFNTTENDSLSLRKLLELKLEYLASNKVLFIEYKDKENAYN
jgi:hypothetical protein